jgi:hypothetical protein
MIMTESAVKENAAAPDKAAKKNAIVQWLSEDVPNIDPNYGWTIVSSLYRYTGSKVRARVMKRRRSAVVANAKKNYKPMGMTCGSYLSRVNSIMDQFVFQEKLYSILRQNVGSYQNIELMHFTEHGKRSIDNAMLNIRIIYQSSNELFKQFQSLGELVKADGRLKDHDALAPEDLDRERIAFEALAEATLREADAVIRMTRTELTTALEFETFKAFAKKNPDDVEAAIEQGRMVAGHLVSAAEAAGGWVPVDTAKKVLDGVAGVGDVLTSFIGKAASSWATKQHVKEIMASPEKRQEAIKYLNTNTLSVAEYLKDKYIETIEQNFALVNLLVAGSQAALNVGLEMTGAGTIVSKVMDRAWKVIKESLITFFTAIQARRIEIALEGLNKGKLSAKGMEKAAQSAAGKVLDFFEEYAKKSPEYVLEHFEETAKKEIFSLLSPLGLLDDTVNSFIGSIIKHCVAQLNIRPAQIFTGDMMVEAVERMSLQGMLGEALPEEKAPAQASATN